MARLRTKVLAAILSPLLFFGAVEGGLRLAGFEYRPDLAAAREEVRRLPASLAARDADLLWTLPRSTRIEVPGAGYFGVATNTLGLRGPEPPGGKLPGELRVLCLGDSITFGLSVLDGGTWPERLEAALRRRLGGRPVRVLNGGVPGWSSVQGMRLLDRLSWFEPDVVVFWFGVNDSHRAWGLPDSEKMAHPLATRAAGILYRLRLVQWIAKTLDRVRDEGEFATRASVEEYRAAIDRLTTAAAAGGPRVIFVRGPTRHDVTARQLERVVAQAEAAGVDTVAGPPELLLSIVPAAEGVDATGRTADGPEGRELRFGDRAGLRWPLSRVREGLDEVRRLESGVAARQRLLPDGSLGREDLFGGEPLDRVLLDNCHLTPLGCRLAGEAVAAEVLRRLPPGR